MLIALLILIPLLTFLIILIAHKYLYKFTKNYYLLAIIAIVFLLYFILFRYVPDFIDFIHKINNNSFSGNYQRSFYWSKILLLDMCPLMTFLIPLSLIVDKTKNIAKCLAPIGLIGAMITLIGGVPFDDVVKNLAWSDFYKYIFIGIPNAVDGAQINRLYFFMHYMLMIISLLTILNAKQYTKWSIMGSALFFVIYIAYALSLSRSLNITNNVTGLVVGDWYNQALPNTPEYKVVYDFMPMSFPGIVIFWYFVATVGDLIICFIKNIFTNDLFKIIRYNQYFYERFNKHQKIYHCFETINHFIDKVFLKRFFVAY